MFALPKVQPQGGTPTTQDFILLQSQWSRFLNPVVEKSAAGDGIPVGAILLWALSEAPEKYLVCDGTVVLQSQYQALFRVIGTTQNTGGEPAGWFRLPAASGAYTLIIKYQP